MINSAETQPPRQTANAEINTAETMMPGKLPPEKTVLPVMAPGTPIADSYIISKLLADQGKQSHVYLAKKWGKSYVVKLYKDGYHPCEQMREYLETVHHANVARVLECGTKDGNYYEIYEYYPEGTLDDVGALTPTHIQNVIVPSVNEGLHQLHKSGIIHCDIKPSNLFYADEKTRVVIGDCGISGYVNVEGKLIDSIRGTPEYAPRVKSLLWSAAMSPAYDYGSFGLVLCRLVLGRSLFAGMSVDEISRAWENGLILPSQISGRVGALICGLLNENEEQRWGYKEVKRWCEGEFIRSSGRSIYATAKKETKVKPFIFGRFDGETVAVTSLHQLAVAIRAHWDQATRVIKRSELVEFVLQFDRDENKGRAEKVRALARAQDLDAAVFKLLMYIDDGPSICYCGKEYGTIERLVSELLSGKDEVAKRFLSSGSLVFYLRSIGSDEAQVDKLEQTIRRNGYQDMAAISTICFVLQGKKTVDVFGVSVETLNGLVSALRGHSIDELDHLLDETAFIAWLNKLGYEKDVRRIREGRRSYE